MGCHGRRTGAALAPERRRCRVCHGRRLTTGSVASVADCRPGNPCSRSLTRRLVRTTIAVAIGALALLGLDRSAHADNSIVSIDARGRRRSDDAADRDRHHVRERDRLVGGGAGRLRQRPVQRSGRPATASDANGDLLQPLPAGECRVTWVVVTNADGEDDRRATSPSRWPRRPAAATARRQRPTTTAGGTAHGGRATTAATATTMRRRRVGVERPDLARSGAVDHRHRPCCSARSCSSSRPGPKGPSTSSPCASSARRGSSASSAR